MKKIILCVLLALFGITGNAEVKREGNTFKVEQSSRTSQGEKTKYTWEDKDGNKYPIYITKKGACYVLRTSKKTGKEYKQYLPKEIKLQIAKELGVLTTEGVKEIINQ